MIVWENTEEEYTLGKRIYHKEDFITLEKWREMKSPSMINDIRYSFHPVGINRAGEIACVGREYPNEFDFYEPNFDLIGMRVVDLQSGYSDELKALTKHLRDKPSVDLVKEFLLCLMSYCESREQHIGEYNIMCFNPDTMLRVSIRDYNFIVEKYDGNDTWVILLKTHSIWTAMNMIVNYNYRVVPSRNPELYLNVSNNAGLQELIKPNFGYEYF